MTVAEHTTERKRSISINSLIPNQFIRLAQANGYKLYKPEYTTKSDSFEETSQDPDGTTHVTTRTIIKPPFLEETKGITRTSGKYFGAVLIQNENDAYYLQLDEHTSYGNGDAYVYFIVGITKVPKLENYSEYKKWQETLRAKRIRVDFNNIESIEETDSTGLAVVIKENGFASVVMNGKDSLLQEYFDLLTK